MQACSRSKEIACVDWVLLFIFMSASLSFLLKVIGGESLLASAVLIKDVFLFLLIVPAILTIVRRGRIRIIDRFIEILTIVFIFICITYAVKSPISISAAGKYLWALVYGPILYLALNQIDLTNININRINRFIYWWLLFITVTAIIIYIIGQESFFEAINLYNFILSESNNNVELLTNFFRTKNGVLHARMTGLLVSNLDMAFVLIISFSVFLWQTKNKIAKYTMFLLWALAIILSTNRSSILGIIVSLSCLWLAKKPILIKIIAIILAVTAAATTAWYMGTLIVSGGLDSSAVTHYYDLFIRGPQLVAQNWKGAGIGMASGSLLGKVTDESFVGNVESFYYMLSIETGICGLLIYLVLIFLILRRLLILAETSPSGKSFNNPFRSIFITVLSLHVGAVFLPVLQSRVISSLMWTLIFCGLNLPRYYRWRESKTNQSTSLYLTSV